MKGIKGYSIFSIILFVFIICLILFSINNYFLTHVESFKKRKKGLKGKLGFLKPIIKPISKIVKGIETVHFDLQDIKDRMPPKAPQ